MKGNHYLNFCFVIWTIWSKRYQVGPARVRTGDLLRVKQTWWPLHYRTILITLSKIYDQYISTWWQHSGKLFHLVVFRDHFCSTMQRFTTELQLCCKNNVVIWIFIVDCIILLMIVIWGLLPAHALVGQSASNQ